MTAILIGMGISIIAYSTAYKKEHSSFEKDKAISTLNKYQKIWNEIEKKEISLFGFVLGKNTLSDIKANRIFPFMHSVTESCLRNDEGYTRCSFNTMGLSIKKGEKDYYDLKNFNMISFYFSPTDLLIKVSLSFDEKDNTNEFYKFFFREYGSSILPSTFLNDKYFSNLNLASYIINWAGFRTLNDMTVIIDKEEYKEKQLNIYLDDEGNLFHYENKYGEVNIRTIGWKELPSYKQYEELKEKEKQDKKEKMRDVFN